MKKPLEVLIAILEDIVTFGLEKVGKYYSSYRATVMDNEDPEGLGRLKLYVPTIAKQTLPVWITQENRYAGNGYGLFNIPEKGDMVFVTFERGNPNYPLWKYGYHGKPKGKNEIPEELRNIKNHWFKTPKGFLIELDEDKNEFRLTHPNGKQVLVGNNISLIRKDGKISIGKLDSSDEPAVLGDKNETVLTDIKEILNDIATTLGTIAGTDAAVASTYGLTYPSQLIQDVPQWIIKINALTAKIEQTKSKNVTLD